MGRPQTKGDLIDQASSNYQKLWDLIDTMPKEAQETPFDFSADPKKKEAHWQRDKNLRDVLIHLYEWHQLLLTWIRANTSGQEQPFLPPPYNWKTYGQMNMALWEKHQGTTYEEAKGLLNKSHAVVMTLLEIFSNEELFKKGVYPWTGTTTLGSYGVSATASHYEWAMKKIRAHIKVCKARQA